MQSIKVVILCNGDFPSAPQPLKALAETNHLICCDGAYNSLMHNLPNYCKPLTIIGDLDSISGSSNVECIHVSEQSTNDQSKAFRLVLKRWPGAEVTILGASGKREDHTIGNISLLADYFELALQSGTSVKMLTDYGIFTPIANPTIFPSFERQQVSLFSMRQGCTILTEGLQYPLNGEQLDLWWQGTLNSSLGSTFSVSPKNGIVLVYQTYEAKI